MTTFADLGVKAELVTVLARHDIVEPFGIQTATLPDSLAGRDVLGRGPTGSGKTVAFALPLVTRLAARNRTRRRGRPAGLVLVPTRELAVQVERTVHFLAKAVGLRTMTVYGGVGYPGQLKNLAAGVDIVIATPGRLEDLIERGACDLSDVQVTVLDEADLMADMGFLPPVRRILELTPPGQRLLFSATLDG
ncbi:MAG TPA: DEAD/DEAH box helicase, partial [Propionicimonas sp.]|nr:DEAD/DEAH box helicase [Propionicimonas sp.]